MIQSVLLFLAPANPPQATPCSPPAVARPATPRMRFRNHLRFGFSVLGNTLGCGVIFATCWFSLQLMQALITS